MSKSEDKLQEAFDKINKVYGAGSVGQLGTMPKLEIECIPSGSMALDGALGGGYPRGRVIELFGEESSGKTTLALHAIAEVQKAGGSAGILDMEHAFDAVYAENLGVDIEALIWGQPETCEEAWETIEILVDSGKVSLLVVDSISAMIPKRELEGEMGDAVVGLQAKLMGQGYRKNIGKMNRNGCTVIFINQLRDNVGVMYGSKKITTGGKATKFYASQRIQVRKVEAVKQGEEIIAHKTEAKIVKNKIAPPHKIAHFNISFGVGINKPLEVLEVCEELDIVKRSGSWFSYNDEKLGQGLNNVVAMLRDNPELMEELESKMIEGLNNLE